MTRRGFTLPELLVTMIIGAILGGALVQFLVNNSRFVERQEATLDARSTARAALNLMATELRMVSDSGLIAASADSVTVRIPIAFGALCRQVGGGASPRVASLTDTLPGGLAGLGVALRIGQGYRTATGVTVGNHTNAGPCTEDSIRVIPGGRLAALSPGNAMSLSGVPNGTILYLFRVVTYRFGPSTSLPGRRALFRRVGGTTEELVSPLAVNAGFAFLVGPRLTVTELPPAQLADVQGLELRLVAESERAPRGLPEPSRFELRPRIKFVNKAM